MRDKKSYSLPIIIVTIVIVFGGLVFGEIFSSISSSILKIFDTNSFFYITPDSINVISENMSFFGIILLICLYQRYIKKESVKSLGLNTTWRDGSKQYIIGLFISTLLIVGLR
ncbi:hypothetical protein [Anaeromicropila herbilytica]|uniref:Uncharacterized protein n=1 Tax=Anaeromicropila herbilytica TaxID=2785025 RepID=A0A7R7IBW8_9FIRM|nr:hypothetical protein [Anaeromicropila herbilytica]BCN29241.1 hypothetical protein bsdtb5_05360 [Anaeromicropila herbilytica]